MDVGTSASTCFVIVNVRRATTHEEHFGEERQKMTVLEQTAFSHRQRRRRINVHRLGLGLILPWQRPDSTSDERHSSSRLYSLQIPQDLIGRIIKYDNQCYAAGSFGDVYRCHYHNAYEVKEIRTFSLLSYSDLMYHVCAQVAVKFFSGSSSR